MASKRLRARFKTALINAYCAGRIPAVAVRMAFRIINLRSC